MQEEQQQQAVAQQEQQQQQEQPAVQQQQQEQQQQEQAAAEPEPAGPPQGGTLRLGIVYSPANYAAPYSGDIAFGPAIWETLTKYGADGLTPEPHLAESWEFNDDQTVLTITLRPGLTFHDGKPLTADEVKKSLERMDDEDVANSQVKSIFNKYVSAVTAIDETTLQLDLAWPGEAIFDALHFANIHDADAIPGLEGYTQVNASGAFKFDTDSYEVDVYARGDRFADSYDPAALDAVEWRTFQDAESMALALQAGELDMVYDLPKSWHANLAEDDGFQVELAPPTSLQWVLGMVGTGRGGGHEIMDDPKVRRAMYRVIDRKRITAEIFEGLSEEKNVLWPKFSPGYNESLDQDYFNVDEARELITEAGYGDGTPPLKIACIAFQQEALDMAQIIQQDAAAAGINVEPEAMEFSTWLDAIPGRNARGALHGPLLVLCDASANLARDELPDADPQLLRLRLSRVPGDDRRLADRGQRGQAAGAARRVQQNPRRGTLGRPDLHDGLDLGLSGECQGVLAGCGRPTAAAGRLL